MSTHVERSRRARHGNRVKAVARRQHGSARLYLTLIYAVLGAGHRTPERWGIGLQASLDGGGRCFERIDRLRNRALQHADHENQTPHRRSTLRRTLSIIIFASRTPNTTDSPRHTTAAVPPVIPPRSSAGHAGST